MKTKRASEGIKLRLSITAKIAIALSLLISFLLISIGASLIFRDYTLFKKEYQNKGWNIVHTAAQFSLNYIQIGNMEFLNDLVKKIGAYNDVSYAAVIDSSGKVLAHTDQKQLGSRYSNEEMKNITATKKDVFKILPAEKDKSSIMDFYSPIVTPGGSTLGYFRLGIDLSGLTQNTKESAFTIVLICLAAIFAGISLAGIISKRIVQKPLSDLTSATERLATGDFSYKVPIRNYDELGDLASAFNTMTVHLANLIQSVKSSAVDINKSAEQILGKIQTTDRTNNRLSQTFDLLKEGTTEQVSFLKKSIELAEQMSEQTKHAMDCVLQILNEVNKATHLGEVGVSAVAKISTNIEDSCQSLESTRNSFIQLEDKVRQFSQSLEHFSILLKKNIDCTVKVALQAARSGDKELTEAAENLHRISEESIERVEQMSGELSSIQETWLMAGSSLGNNLERLGDGQEAVKEAGESLQKVVRSLQQSKDIIEEIASAAHRQSSSVDEIISNQNSIVDELTKSINKSSGAGNDTKLQTESLHDIDSLAKKLMRMVERLNVLSLQFKV